MGIILAKALRTHSAPCIAFAGAGGKTTSMFQLARQLPQPVIVSATTHLGIWQIRLADQHIIAETPAPLEEREHGLQGIILVTGPIAGDRTTPVTETLMDWLHQFCGYHSIPLLIEADGARQKPLKAWADHEPPIPAFVDQVVQVAGLSGLGKPLNEDNVHRAALFSQLSDLNIGDPIGAEAVVRVLTRPEGGIKNIPSAARRVVLLNQADRPDLQAIGRGMAQRLIPVFDSVIIASAEHEQIFAVHEAIAGIILAAGGSTRFGEPKQLLDWRGQPFVRVVALNALEAGLWPVVVVTGADAERVEAAIRDLDVLIVRNDEWKSGQAASLKAGVRALLEPATRLRQSAVGGAIFLLADQPQVTSSVIRALVEKHAEGLHPVVAPMVADRRANPVLFDRSTFADLLSLEGDVGGRAILHKYRVEYLPWHDEHLLLDVDTPEQYRRLISDEA